MHAPTFAGNEWRYLRECLDTGWVSSAGPFVERFESAFGAYTGALHTVATVNATAALHVALRVVGVQPNDEVIVPDLTFIAPASAIRYCGAVPVLLDVDPGTWQLDAGKLERFLAEECVVRRGRCINRRSSRIVRAVVPVHLLGLACEIDRIVDLARRYRLAVVEDAAQATGVRYKGRSVGTFGDVGVFSFNGNKIITAGGGGAVVTNDARHAAYTRYLTTHAKDDDPVESFHSEIGFNYRLSNLHAAVGLAQLEQLDALIARQRRVAEMYERAFSRVDELVPMPVPAHTEPTFWLYTIQLHAATVRRRQEVVRQLNERGIGARPLWHPLHGLPPLRGCQRYRIEHATRLYARSVCLPASANLDDADVRRCIHAVIAVVGSRA